MPWWVKLFHYSIGVVNALNISLKRFDILRIELCLIAHQHSEIPKGHLTLEQVL
jgi:hypothetical protein